MLPKAGFNGVWSRSVSIFRRASGVALVAAAGTSYSITAFAADDCSTPGTRTTTSTANAFVSGTSLAINLPGRRVDSSLPISAGLVNGRRQLASSSSQVVYSECMTGTQLTSLPAALLDTACLLVPDGEDGLISGDFGVVLSNQILGEGESVAVSVTGPTVASGVIASSGYCKSVGTDCCEYVTAYRTAGRFVDTVESYAIRAYALKATDLPPFPVPAAMRVC